MYSFLRTSNKTSPTWRLLVDIYWAVKLQGEYPPQATDTEVNSYFNVYRWQNLTERKNIMPLETQLLH